MKKQSSYLQQDMKKGSKINYMQYQNILVILPLIQAWQNLEVLLV